MDRLPECIDGEALPTNAAFLVPGIERVEIRHDKANVASAGVPLSLGGFIGERADEAATPADTGIECVWRVERGHWEPR
jgi:RimJ/RimL family protein N-acetyltransferase